jgi:hypothetical protein
MIVTDLDRTLLTSGRTISAYTKDVLRRCCEKGIKLVFATARPKRGVTHFCADVPVDALILHNGAVTYAGGKRAAVYGIDPAARDIILSAIKNDVPDVMLSVEIDDVLYANFDVASLWPDTQAVLSDLTGLPDKTAEKIIIGISSADEIGYFKKYVTENLYIQNSENSVGMILNRSATKWNAVAALASRFGISAADIIAFGDDFNDVEIIRRCGFGVAVENAIAEAKAAADFICGANDCDGVANWLAERLL